MAKRVLLLTADPDLGDMLADYLVGCGHTVMVPGQGHQALQRLLREGRVDVVLAEQADLARLSVDVGPRPVICLSEMGQGPAVDPGVVRSLTKPVSLHEIGRLLAAL